MEQPTTDETQKKKPLTKALEDMPTMYALPLAKLLVIAACAIVFGLIRMLFGRSSDRWHLPSHIEARVRHRARLLGISIATCAGAMTNGLFNFCKLFLQP